MTVEKPKESHKDVIAGLMALPVRPLEVHSELLKKYKKLMNLRKRLRRSMKRTSES